MTYRQAMHLRRLIATFVTESARQRTDLNALGHSLDVLNRYINRLTEPQQSDRPDQRNALGGWGWL